MLTPNAAELSSLGRSADFLLRSSCNIERNTVIGKDQYGKETREWTPVRYNVKCDKSPMRETVGAEGEIAGKIWARGVWMVKVPIGTDVKISDRIVIDGTALYVDNVLAPRSYSVVIRVICTENE